MSADWPGFGRGPNDFGGDWTAYLEDCYRQYRDDFHGGSLPWPVSGQSLNIKRMPVDERGWCNTFWHLVTEGSIETERLPVVARLQRIGWPMALLTEFNHLYPARQSDRVCWWIKSWQGKENRYLLALADFSYLIVMADRGSYVLLWTAYPVEQQHRRNKLRREFDEYWKETDMAGAALD